MPLTKGVQQLMEVIIFCSLHRQQIKKETILTLVDMNKSWKKITKTCILTLSKGHQGHHQQIQAMS